MKKTENYISRAISSIHEMFKTGGFIGNDKDYSYWLVIWKNGDETVIDNFSVAWEGLPKMNAREIKEIRLWLSGGPHAYRLDECYTKDSYSYKEYLPEQM